MRNWDYRYAWPRDASIGIAAFLDAGLPDEAHSFLHWLLYASRLTRPRLRVLYTLDGKPGPEEQEVPGVPGYRGSRPVRIGNEATGQHQLDVYGWVVDAAWAVVRSGRRLDGETWRTLAGVRRFRGRRVARAGCRHLGDTWEGRPAHSSAARFGRSRHSP
jgi:GH15 family glucan-1,4-alpha-glucosidase